MDQVPVLGSPVNNGNNIPTIPIPFTTIPPVYPPVNNITLLPAPAELGVTPPPALYPLPLMWPAVTNLVAGRDGCFQQSGQTPEVQACLGAAVRRANGNLVFVDAFPDAFRKSQWLGEALVMELNDCRGGSVSMAAIDDRARGDEKYFKQLLYMVICFVSAHNDATTNDPSQISGRWSAFRQGVIDMARSLVTSAESSYGVHASDGQVQTARGLLSNDAYHFGKTAAVST